MKKAGILLKFDGVEVPVSAKDQRKGFTLQELYDLIGNGCVLVERIMLNSMREMWLDEEGKLHKTVPPINWKATELLHKAGGSPDDYVVGNVVVL